MSHSATHGLQHARPPCPSPTPRAYSNSFPSSWWCHQTISSSVIPFSSCLQYFPASGSFPSQFFASGGQAIKSFSFSIRPSNESSGLISFRIDWLDLLAVQGTLRSLFQHHSSKVTFPSDAVSIRVRDFEERNQGVQRSEGWSFLQRASGMHQAKGRVGQGGVVMEVPWAFRGTSAFTLSTSF